jgi:hypothetical protein
VPGLSGEGWRHNRREEGTLPVPASPVRRLIWQAMEWRMVAEVNGDEAAFTGRSL